MAVKVTERKRKAFESKIEGADKVEIKITVTGNEAFLVGHGLDPNGAQATKTNSP